MPKAVDSLERIQQMQSLASKRKGRLLSKSWQGSKYKYEWTCEFKHSWRATWASINTNESWCPKCMSKVRGVSKSLSESEVNSRLMKRGLKLTNGYDYKLSLQYCVCLVCGKETRASFDRIPKGYGCRECLRDIQPTYRRNDISKIVQELKKLNVEILGNYSSVDKRKQFKCVTCNTPFESTVSHLRKSGRHICSNYQKEKEQIINFLESHGFQLGPDFQNRSSEFTVICNSCGEKQKTNFSRFSSKNSKCNTCLARNSLEKLRIFAEERGGKLLEKSYLGFKKKHKWRCSVGHEWRAIPSKKSWCPDCAGRNKSISDIKKIVRARRGKLITEQFLGVTGKYQVTCSRGHSFSISFSKMSQGQWCSICSKGSKSEELVRATMEQIFLAPFVRIRPNWLKNDLGFNMELDGFNEELSIAFEYQGKQHYEHADYLKDHDWVRTRKNDQLKARICKQRGIKLFYFDYTQNYKDFPKIAIRQAKEFKLLPGDFKLVKPVDFEKAYIKEDRLFELKYRAGQRNIEILSKNWIGTTAKYQVRCKVCFQKYEVAGTAFMGKKINRCRFCVRGANFNPNTLDISRVREYALVRGGELLSSTYKSMHSPLRWKCSKEHEFMAAFNNLTRRNQFCPICEGRSVRRKR